MMAKNFASQNNLALKRIVYTYLLLLDNARIFLRLNHIWLLFFLWHTLPNSIYHSVHFYYSVLYHYFSTHQVLALVEFALGEDWVHLLANVTVVIILHVTIRLLMTSFCFSLGSWSLVDFLLFLIASKSTFRSSCSWPGDSVFSPEMS